MGNPQSKPCYFNGDYYNESLVAKVALRDSIATKDLHYPIAGGKFGCNFHCWIKRGSMIIDPTVNGLGVPDEAASSERLYFPFDRRVAVQLLDVLADHIQCEFGSPQAVDKHLSWRARTKTYPHGECYYNCRAYQWADPGCTLMIGAVGYKSYEYVEHDGHVMHGVFDKRKPFVMLDYGL
jgi:hypothetical protein